MTGRSASKRARLLRSMTDAVVRPAVGLLPGLVERVDCYGRRGGGCGKLLAEILYAEDGEIGFVVRAPYTLDAGVVVLQKAGKINHAAAVVPIPDGTDPTFRCPRCGKFTTVNMAALAERAPRTRAARP